MNQSKKYILDFILKYTDNDNNLQETCVQNRDIDLGYLLHTYSYSFNLFKI